MLRTKIKKLLKESTGRKTRVEHPANPEFGDYSTNVALTAKLNAQDIAQKLRTDPIFEKVEASPPGFINFELSRQCLHDELKNILRQGEKFGQLKIGQNKKVQVEFISANPTGILHIGNGRGGFFGDALANVLEMAGFKVVREYYINDAKANTQIKTLGQTALGKGDVYLTLSLRDKILNLKSKILNLQLKTKNLFNIEGEVGHLLAKEVQKDNKNFITKKLKIKFDNWVSEENLYKTGEVKKIYQRLKTKKLVYQKEGAEWLKISQFGSPKDEVIIRQSKEPTYFLSDIAYHQQKFNQDYAKIINIWGADHQGHVPRIKAVAKILGYKGDLDILICQMVRLKRGKLSKRKGQIVELKWLIDEVGLDAARFFYLTKSLDTQMEFDVELAKERSAKSPVYYVQYAHARICSILANLKSKNLNLKSTSKNLNLLTHPSELNLIKKLVRFPEVIEDTAQDYQVQRLPQYAVDLATAFHQFYRDCRVLGEDKKITRARLALVLATKTVLKNTLGLMGITAPEKM